MFAFNKDGEFSSIWFIKRGKPHEDVPSMELVYNSVSHIMASPFQALVKAKAKAKPHADTFTVKYPCLVNTVAIEAGAGVILKCDQQLVPKPEANEKERTAYDQLMSADGKEREAHNTKTLEA